VPKVRDDPTPARISLRAMRANPPPPGEGKEKTCGLKSNASARRFISTL
jgi:hypothetical protein